MAKNESKYVRREAFMMQPDELKQKAKDLFRFLALIHPTACTDAKNKGTIEVRFLLRGEFGTIGLHSFNTWNLGESDELQLLKKLEAYNGYACCTYYSLYTYDYHQEIGGEKPRKIQKTTALYTEALVIDFDGLSENEFLAEKERLSALGIETLDVFSGHGYQSIILLEEKCDDTDMLKKFTELVLRKGFKADSKMIDPARICRTPFTFNCKAFCKGDKYYNPDEPMGIPTFIYAETDKRYTVSDVMEKIASLDDVAFDDSDMEYLLETFGDKDETVISEPAASEKSVKQKPKKPVKAPKATAKKEEKPNVEIKSKEEFKALYKHLEFDKLPQAVQDMLMGTPHGLRNDVLLFIIPFLRNSLGLGVKEIIEILEIWGEHCEPAISNEEIRSEVLRLGAYDLQAKYGRYTEGLEECYGSLVIDEWIDEDEIIIMNEFYDKLKTASDGAVQLYLAIRYLEHLEERNNFTKEEICDFMGIAGRTFNKHIVSAVKEGLVTKKKWDAVKKEGQTYEYYANPFLSSSKGFTRIKALLVEKLLGERFTGGEVSFYLYVKYQTNNKNKTCFTSQTKLAEALGKKSHATISKMTDALHAKRFIRKKTEKRGRTMHSTYRLLF